MTENNGKILTQAVNIVNRAGHEINAMLDIAATKICSSDFKEVKKIKRGYESLGKAITDSGWVYTNEINNIDFTPKDYSRKPKGVLGIEAVIGDSGERKSLAKDIPVLNIMFDMDESGQQGHWDTDLNMYVSETDWKDHKLMGDSGLIYLEDYSGVSIWNKNIKGWYFSIPLTSLNRPEDLDKLVVEPIQIIFKYFENFLDKKKNHIDSYFKEQAEIIRYQKDNDTGFKPV